MAKNIIKVDSFMCGLFLKIKKVNAVELKYIVEDFEAKTNSEVSGYFDYCTLPYVLTNCLAYDEAGDLELTRYVLDAKDYFRRCAGEIVNDYFANLDVTKLMKEKDKAYEIYKERVLNNANILLISNNENEYQELLKFGFKNVDFFKSIIRADKYFLEHPNELNKYHIVIRGKGCTYGKETCNLSIIDKINHLNYDNHIIETYMLNEEERSYFYMYLHDYIRPRTLQVRTESYKDLYESLADNAFINNVLEAHPVDNEQYLKYTNVEVKEKIPLPKKKSDLKVLFYGCFNDREKAGIKEYFEKLGLQLEFGIDDNNNLMNTILHHLGEYDIIIASKIYSEKILKLGVESAEQCKDTGRQLVLLTDYTIDDFYTSKNINQDNSISTIELEYVLAGEKAKDEITGELQYEVANQNMADVDLLLYYIYGNLPYDEQTISNLKNIWSNKASQVCSIVEAAVTLYKRALNKMGEEVIEDFDFKTPDEYYLEVLDEYNRLKEHEDAAIEEINMFKELMARVKDYLYFKKNYRIHKNNNLGLEVFEKDGTITIENLFNDRVLCAIEVQDYNYGSNIYRFKMRVLSEKGTLMPPQEVGVYTIYYNNKEGLPPRLNEKQLTALKATLKKVENVLGRLEETAENDYRHLKYVKKISKKTIV